MPTDEETGSYLVNSLLVLHVQYTQEEYADAGSKIDP